MFAGEYLHRDLAEMAAAYLFHIVQNHPFVDGNKRTGIHAAAVFFMLNGVPLALPTDSTEKLVLNVATAKSRQEGSRGVLPSTHARSGAGRRRELMNPELIIPCP
jgi:death-on-curing family protein